MPWQSVAGKCALGGSSAHIGRKAVHRGPQAVSRAFGLLRWRYAARCLA